MRNVKVKKKDGIIEDWDFNKIRIAVEKSAKRADFELTDNDYKELKKHFNKKLKNDTVVDVYTIHGYVESILLKRFPPVGKSYRDFRNYKKTYVEMFEQQFQQAKNTLYLGDRENANFDSSLTSTKSAIIGGHVRRDMYKTFQLSGHEKQAIHDGFIYIHDLNFLLLGCHNCMLCDIATILKGGFVMANLEYEDIHQFRSACNVIGDLTLSATAQQFGGFTIPEIDKVLLPYARNSLAKYLWEARKYGVPKDRIREYANDKLHYDYSKCLRGLEAKLNTITSSRGDTAFVTFSFGCLDNKREDYNRMQADICKYILQTRINGHGKGKAPVVFPKLVYLYASKNHVQDYQKDLFELALKCTARSMYPDFLSLDAGDTGEIYQRTGKVVSPMGCRAYLSDFKDENGESYFVGRGNIGAVSLNLPMIWQKSKGKTFYEDLDYYLQMIREFHKKRYEYIADMSASTNPLCFCEGGVHGGHRTPTEKIGLDLLKQFTASFGITALNELNVLMEGKPLHESDRRLINKVVDYINDKLKQFKHEDGWAYALYGTPAESLCFAGDTVVQAYPTNKPIKDIEVGDLVYSWNEKERCVELKRVSRKVLTNPKAKVLKITFDTGQDVVCTPNHPFAKIECDGIEYVESTRLKPNDIIKTNWNNGVKVVSVEHLDIEIPVYDITVEDNHNFFVCGDRGVLVHNCGTQVQQFRKMFGIIEGVSDKDYFTNSFHCHVSADITPFEKQDLEEELFHKCNGGHIQYVKLDNPDNIDALRAIVLRGMQKGFYQGINFSDITCMQCGYHTSVETERCPICGSTDILWIERICGYLSIRSYRGSTRVNDAKLAEMRDRISM